MKLLLIILFLFLSACINRGDDENPYKNWSPKKFYTEAKLDIESGAIDAAIIKLEKLQTTYPASKFSAQAKLDIAYALYQNGEYKRAISQLSSYIKLYPNYSSLDYAYYMRGIISDEKSKSLLDGIVIDEAQKNIKGTQESLEYYKLLISKFPHSKYSKEASGRLIRLQNKLARSELLIANFYYRRDANIAAINRLQYLIEQYPKTHSMPIALTLLEEIYIKMHMTSLAADVRRIMDASYKDYSVDLEKELGL